jgi:drug/metabolite transporter (DMT)-like permease
MKRVTISIPWPFSSTETRAVLLFAFQTALVTYLGLYLIETLQAGFVSRYFEIETFLWITVVAGLLHAVWPYVVPESETSQAVGWMMYVWIAILALGMATVIWYKMQSLGGLAAIASSLTGLIAVGYLCLAQFEWPASKPKR